MIVSSDNPEEKKITQTAQPKRKASSTTIDTRKTKKVVKRDPIKERTLKKKIPDMSLHELSDSKDYVQQFGNADLAIQFIEQMIISTNDQEKIRELRLELADIYFDNAKMKEAARAFRTYIKFYPGSKERDYAQYKEILSRFYARLAPPLDQSITRKTISLIQVYLNKQASQKAYEQEVKKLLKTCHHDLYTYELDIFKQYCKSKKFIGAETRLTEIKKEFIPIMEEIQPELYEWEGYLAQQQGKTEIVAQTMKELKTKFPDYSPTILVAYNKPTKKDYVTKF